MKSMKETTSPLAANLAGLRKCHQYSQEEVAEKIGVTRQAVAKWESGETMPDILNCDALAALYGVSLDDLVHHEGEKAGYPIPPKGKHMFGTVTVGERGQIVLPKKSRDLFQIRAGDSLMVLGSEEPESYGLALVNSERFMQAIESVLRHFRAGGER